MSDYLVKMLEYYFNDGAHVIFEKYTIDTLGVIKHKETGQTRSYGNGMYNVCTVYDNNGKQCMIRVARAVASTFLGKPPTSEHTADHIESDQKKNDALSNIRWLCKPGQISNQIRQDTLKSAFVVVKDGIEKTIKEWVRHMNAAKSLEKRKITYGMIAKYAQRKQQGFAYKEYPDFPGEMWEQIEGSKTNRGYWEISNMNRVRYITKHASNVMWGDRLGRQKEYPTVVINGKKCGCHVLAFKSFHKKLWDAKKPEDMVLHENDDKEDFRPHKLRLGTQSNNMKDSQDNGKRDGTKSARMKCASYIDGVHEENHNSQTDAAKYLKFKGCSEASIKNISASICMTLTGTGERKMAYGRTWKII